MELFRNTEMRKQIRIQNGDSNGMVRDAEGGNNGRWDHQRQLVLGLTFETSVKKEHLKEPGGILRGG